jgi:aminopeptidase-like protein|tara:strand:+ start:488 stop:889 length:402 start_codon:yes stop_codon:yes gene_type:complete
VLKLYILVVVVGLVGGSVYGAYYYYKDSQDRIRILTENTAKLETAKKMQDQTINIMIEDREKFAELNKELQLNLTKANVYKDKLIGKLRKHNLAKLSLRKPRLVEKKINAGTKKLFRSLEVLSGAVAPAPAVK